MAVLENLLKINNIDVYARFGAFLAETAEDEHENYDSLMAMPQLKEQVEVSVREEDGVRMPATIAQSFEPRDITLRFAIVAPDDRTFIARYFSFIEFLRSGNGGWLDISLEDVGLTFHVYMRKASSYSQTIPFGRGEVAAIFSIVFREPRPSFVTPSNDN